MVEDFKNIISREIYCPDEKESIKIVCIMCNMKEKNAIISNIKFRTTISSVINNVQYCPARMVVLASVINKDK